MCVAPCSCRTRISLIFESTSASKIGIAAPPESPKMYSTPSRSRHWMSFSAPVGSLPDCAVVVDPVMGLVLPQRAHCSSSVAHSGGNLAPTPDESRPPWRLDRSVWKLNGGLPGAADHAGGRVEAFWLVAAWATIALAFAFVRL